jgi:hypothetical protein
MSDTKTKTKELVKSEKETYGPSPLLSILADLKELLDDTEEYRP